MRFRDQAALARRAGPRLAAALLGLALAAPPAALARDPAAELEARLAALFCPEALGTGSGTAP
jgi:hypothetical protein